MTGRIGISRGRGIAGIAIDEAGPAYQCIGMKISRIWPGVPRKVFAWLAACVLGLGAAAGGSFFKVIGMTPMELATVESFPPVFSLATLPASDLERSELIAALLAPPDGRMREGAADLAVQLLELQGDRQQAIEIAEQRAGTDCDPLHHVRLLFRDGRTEHAKRIFSDIQTDETRILGYRGMPRVRTFAALWPFIIGGSLEEMSGFLEWLQPQCRKSEWRSAVLAQRLELALHSGELERWTVRMGWESKIARDIARRWIDPRTPEIVPDAKTSLADLAWIVSIEGCTHRNAPYLRRFIETGVGSMAERRELLHQIVDRAYRNSALRDQILVLWMKREEEFIALIMAVMRHYSSSRSLPYEELAAIARNHPDDYLLNFIAGHNQTSRTSPTVVTPCALNALARAYLAAPLLATEPESSSWNHRSFGSSLYYLPPWVEDSAFHALYQLRERLTSTRLYELVHQHEGFLKLPLAGRHRYLRAAALDVPATRVMFEIDWNDPHNDRFGDDMAFAYGSTLPPDVLERYHAILPDIISGSPEKPVDLITAHSRQSLWLLLQQKDRVSPGTWRMLETWHRRLSERGPEAIMRVLDEVIGQRHAPNFEVMEEIFGREAANQVRDTREQRRINGVKAVAIARFGPAGLHGFPFGYEPRPLVRGTWQLTSSPQWINYQHAEYPRSAWLAPRYPALAAIFEPWGPFPLNGIDDWSARIRSILPARSALAAGYDIALVSGDLSSEDEKALRRAVAHVGRMLAESKDADFVLMRASRGVSLKHARPPEDPEALRELAILRDAPLPVRFAAMHLANFSPDKEFREMMAESFGVTGGPPHRGIDPPMEPSRPPAPDLHRLFRQALAFEDVAELASFLASLPEDHDSSPLAFLESEVLLARFKSPDHDHLLELLRVRHDPATGTFGVATAMRPPTDKEVARLHAFLLDQDRDSARSLRELVIERGWPMPAVIADVLLGHGERDAAVNWLARSILACFRPANEWAGHHRFPKPPRWFDPYDLERLLPRDALATISREKLAIPVALVIENMPQGDDPLLLGFLRFFDDPCLESYERHLGSLEFPDMPAYPNRLRGHVARVLMGQRETRALGEELRRIYMDQARGR